MTDEELRFGFYFLCLRSSFQVLMIPFFQLTAFGVLPGVITKIKIIALAFCKHRPVNFGSTKQYSRAQMVWAGDFSVAGSFFFLAQTERGKLARGENIWKCNLSVGGPPSSGLWALNPASPPPLPNASRGMKGRASDSSYFSVTAAPAPRPGKAGEVCQAFP